MEHTVVVPFRAMPLTLYFRISFSPSIRCLLLKGQDGIINIKVRQTNCKLLHYWLARVVFKDYQKDEVAFDFMMRCRHFKYLLWTKNFGKSLGQKRETVLKIVAKVERIELCILFCRTLKLVEKIPKLMAEKTFWSVQE